MIIEIRIFQHPQTSLPDIRLIVRFLPDFRNKSSKLPEVTLPEETLIHRKFYSSKFPATLDNRSNVSYICIEQMSYLVVYEQQMPEKLAIRTDTSGSLPLCRCAQRQGGACFR